MPLCNDSTDSPNSVIHSVVVGWLCFQSKLNAVPLKSDDCFHEAGGFNGIAVIANGMGVGVDFTRECAGWTFLADEILGFLRVELNVDFALLAGSNLQHEEELQGPHVDFIAHEFAFPFLVFLSTYHS